MGVLTYSVVVTLVSSKLQYMSLFPTCPYWNSMRWTHGFGLVRLLFYYRICITLANLLPLSVLRFIEMHNKSVLALLSFVLSVGGW